MTEKIILVSKLCTLFVSSFASTVKKKGKFLSNLDVPERVRNVGSLLDVYINLSIPLEGQASIRERHGVPYVVPPDGPYGTLWLGSYRQREGTLKSVRETMPVACVNAQRVLTKYPYSLLLALVRLIVNEPQGRGTLDEWVPRAKALEWCSQFGLPEEEFEEEIPYDDLGEHYLRLRTFQWEILRLYLIFRLWEAHIEWHELIKQNDEPIDPSVIEEHRTAIRHYASLLINAYGAQSQSLISAAPVLRAYINRERVIRRHIEQSGQTNGEAKAALSETLATLDARVQTYIHELISWRNWSIQPGFSPMRQKAPGIFMQTRSLFDVAYLQLGSLTLRLPGEWRVHWKSCAWPGGCGRQFWARHGHEKYCEEHNKRQSYLARHPRGTRNSG
jgi:hypothetical protein